MAERDVPPELAWLYRGDFASPDGRLEMNPPPRGPDTRQMTRNETIGRLRKIADGALRPLVDRDYRYLMMPDHGNAGDTFIYLGERAFLGTTGFQCLEETTMLSFSARDPKIGRGDLLIVRGGFSVGDVWTEAPRFWMDAMSRRKDNPVLFLPQTVRFSRKDSLEETRRAIGSHGNVTLCVRDRDSFELASANFDCRVVLAPDSAFFWDPGVAREPGTGDLLIERNDREAPGIPRLLEAIGRPDATVSDWPSRISPDCECQILHRLQKRIPADADDYDRFVRTIWCRHVATRAIRLFRPFRTVWSTRLHGAILALLMDKETVMIDNRYGKSRSFYDTWLAGCEGLRMLDAGR